MPVKLNAVYSCFSVPKLVEVEEKSVDQNLFLSPDNYPLSYPLSADSNKGGWLKSNCPDSILTGYTYGNKLSKVLISCERYLLKQLFRMDLTRFFFPQLRKQNSF
jgi:hypothetical protein